jgi:hypothetical protein
MNKNTVKTLYSILICLLLAILNIFSLMPATMEPIDSFDDIAPRIHYEENTWTVSIDKPIVNQKSPHLTCQHTRAGDPGKACYDRPDTKGYQQSTIGEFFDVRYCYAHQSSKKT